MPRDTPFGRLLVRCLCLPSHLPFAGFPCLSTRQFVAFFFVGLKPQQSPESSICSHIGTRSDGGIRSVVSHASSTELFALPRSRKAEVLKSPAMMSASFFSVTLLSWPSSCFATSFLFAVALRKCAETAVYVLFPCPGGLLNLDVIHRNSKPKESCFHQDLFLDLRTIKLYSGWHTGRRGIAVPHLLRPHGSATLLL